MDGAFVCMTADQLHGTIAKLQIEIDRLTAELEKYKKLEHHSQDQSVSSSESSQDQSIAYSESSQDQSISYSERDYETIKKTVYGHARNQPKDAQMGVAFVILNRATSRRESGATVDEICRESGQFWIGLYGEPEIDDVEVYNSFDEWLPGLIKGEIQDLTNGAQFFLHHWDTNHAFLENVDHVATHGTFKFYK